MSGNPYLDITPQGSNGPSCPYCGLIEGVTRVDNEHGKYYCSCGSLFEGTEDEWRRLARHRQLNVERRAGKRPPAKPAPKSPRDKGAA